jgi:hypothetical protein
VASGWVLVNWSAASTNQSGFLIERSTNGGAWTVVGAVAANVSFFDDMRAARGKTYAYRVAAYNAVGVSNYSAGTAGVRPASATVGHALVSLAGTGTAAASPATGVTTNAATFAGAHVGPSFQPATNSTPARSDVGQAFEVQSASLVKDFFWTSASGDEGGFVSGTF